MIITSIYPGEFHDPYTLEVALRRKDVDIRWANGQSALFFPQGPGRLYTETLSVLSPRSLKRSRPISNRKRCCHFDLTT